MTTSALACSECSALGPAPDHALPSSGLTGSTGRRRRPGSCISTLAARNHPHSATKVHSAVSASSARWLNVGAYWPAVTQVERESLGHRPERRRRARCRRWQRPGCGRAGSSRVRGPSQRPWASLSRWPGARPRWRRRRPGRSSPEHDPICIRQTCRVDPVRYRAGPQWATKRTGWQDPEYGQCRRDPQEQCRGDRSEGGPVVMLAHGFGCDQNLWRLVAPALARGFPGGAVRPRRGGPL